MDRVSNRLWLRLTSVVLVINAVLLPVLFSGLLFIVKQSLADAFIDEVRSYSRLLANELELSDTLANPERTRTLLDSIILSGRVAYAEVTPSGGMRRSDLIPAQPSSFPGDDFAFGDHDDRTYFLSVPINRPGGSVVLRLGFDETPTLEHIERARTRILLALVAFALVSVALAIWLATRIAQPMIHLQNAARRIATGNFDAHLSTQSSIQEVQELAGHLESMRSELVGINERLSREMLERESANAERRGLESRLRHSERVATVGTLAGGIAHEFNNILTPILLYAQTALEEIPPTNPATADLARVIAAAHRARALVNRILAFSRDFESGPGTLVRMGPIVEEVLALLRAIVPSNVEISYECPREHPAILGDPTLLHQLVMNLCTNASQAMRGTGGLMRVRLSRERLIANDPRVARGDYVVLEVADTGHGMDERTRSRIFEPFFTTREVGEGTGLGLSVAHGIVASMGASILVDSEVGQGARFRVYFPVANAAGDSPSLTERDSDVLSTHHR
ncbi:MAG TPA: ATP-binding protein [Steroidobacteraceae bacterium]|jgi:signal transduction histidine kinase